jgi:hypothetical protein
MEPQEHMDLSSLERAVRADLERERGAVAWLRSRSTPVRVALAVGFGVLVGALTVLLAARHDLHAMPPARLALSVAWFGIASGTCAWLALRPLFLAPPSRGLVAAVAAFAFAGPVVTALLPELPTTAYHHAYRAGLAGMACFSIGAAVSALALLFARALDRGGSRAGGQLVLAAAAAGLVGNLALVLHCPLNHPGHLLLGHATVPLAVLLALLAGRALRR